MAERDASGLTDEDQDARGSSSEGAAQDGRSGAALAEDWRASIENRDHRTFAERFPSVGDAVAFAYDQRQKLSTAIRPPGKDAGPEELAAFHRKLGVPETAAGYDIALPAEAAALAENEAVRGRLDRFRAAMHAAGAPPATVQQAVSWFFEETAAEQVAIEKAQVAATEAQRDVLRQEWPGDEFARNAEFAQRAARAFDPDGRFAEFLENRKLDGVALGDHPAFLRVFAAIGRGMTEDRPRLGSGEHGVAQNEARIATLTREAHDALDRGDKETAERLFAERDALDKKLHGSGAIVGSGERVA